MARRVKHTDRGDINLGVQKDFQGALGRIAAVVANVPFGEWEERPRELIRATDVTLPK